MTRTHWILYLTTTFTSALLAAAGNSCPHDFPFAFNGGDDCCANSFEKHLNPSVNTCNGSLISKSSTCCQEDKFVGCPTKPCENYGTCTTSDCLDVSKRVLRFMNPEANPCIDFNQFACGKFIQEYQLSPDEATWSPLKAFGDVINERGKHILENVPKNKSAYITDDFSRRVYKSCMNISEINGNGFKNAKKALKKAGGWPVLEGASWNASGYNWWDQDLKKVSLGLQTSFIMDLHTFKDLSNNKKIALVLDQASLGLSRNFLLEGFNGKNVQLYYKFMVESAKVMGAQNDTAYEDMKQALLFEIELANISAGAERWYDIPKMNNKRTVRELDGQPGYPPSLLDYLNNYLASAGVSEFKLNLSDVLTVYNLDYFKKLAVVVKKTSPRIIANYQSWRLYYSLVSLLHEDAQKVQEEFDKGFQGLKAVPPRWKTCLTKAGFNAGNGGLTLAAGSLYARKYFTPEGKQKVKELIKYLKNSFDNILRKANWMDTTSKSYAFRKLRAMREHAVYHDDILKPNVMNDLFKDLKITDSYFDNVLAIKRFWRAHYFRNLKKAVDLVGLTQNQLVAIGNAFHALVENSVKIPGGILQENVFDPFGPKFKNYGGIGFIINHEITHGFDNMGRLFDLNGNLKPWMTNTTSQNFDQRAKCILYQYGNMTSKQAGINLNAATKQDENIADNGAVNAAYYAYEKYIQDNGEEPILPGISLNTRQLYYLFYGQFFCAKWRTEALIDKIKNQHHAPEEFRINIPLSNSPEFAKVYKCPLGSPMNPVKKCKVW